MIARELLCGRSFWSFLASIDKCVGSAEMGQTASLVKLEIGNKNCEGIYRFRANPGMSKRGVLPPSPVLAPGSALGSRLRVAPPPPSSLSVPRGTVTEQIPSGRPFRGRPDEQGSRADPISNRLR